MILGDSLTPVLHENGAIATDTFTPADWGVLVREARRTNLLSRVAHILSSSNRIQAAPQNIQLQFESALRVAQSSARSVRWEVRKIHAALSGSSIPFILLKGAAYEMAELPASTGRLFVDVDILVPSDRIHDAEVALVNHGWLSSNLDAYDQKYYRTWMHEIPPMHNIKRNTSLDVHHTIIPPTASLKPDVSLLWNEAVKLPGWPGMYVLCPVDMILHSSTHLFHDGELDGGLRDIVDLDALLRHFAQEDGFWSVLLDRGQQLNLMRPLYYALKYVADFLGTPVPGSVLAKAEVLGAPPLGAASLMNVLVRRVMNPTRENLDAAFTGFSKWILYVRSHYLRMPLYLLIPHLTRKALKSE